MSAIAINVRYLPDGDVQGIGECPAGASPQAWYDHLCNMTPESFAPLSGGRAVFTVPSERLAVLKDTFLTRNGRA